MKFVSVFLALALAAMAAAPVAAAPLEAYGKLPSIEAVAVSPSGKSLAMVATDGEARMIVVQEIASGQLTHRSRAGVAKVRYVEWAGDGHLIIVTSATARARDVISDQREWTMATSLDLATGKQSPLMRDAKDAMNVIRDVPAVRTYKGKPAVFLQGIHFVNGRGQVSLFRIDLDRGSSELVGAGAADTRDWLVGPNGEPLAQELWDRNSGRWALKLKTPAGWREVANAISPIDRPTILGLGRDGQSVLYTDRDDKNHLIWRERGPDGAPQAAPLEVSDGQGAIHDPDGRLIGQYVLAGDEGHYTFFDPHHSKVWAAVTKAYAGSIVSLESWSADWSKLVVRVDSPTEGRAYAIVHMDTKQATWIGAEYQGLEPEDIAPRTPVRFRARDGLQLTGYLTVPRGREAKGLPLIVFPHGGPAARDTPGFDWWAQGMASRGYAVLQVNFRGSEGLGDALLTAGYGEWGRKMQTDLSDGVTYLAGEGTIDPKRVCIVGASYGGYAALAGATLDLGVYRCAASFGGLSDLGRFVNWSKATRGKDAFRYWTRFMGAQEDRAVLADISPAAHADKVTIPVLLIHGKDDSVVPLEQSQIMADALRKAGKPVELVVQTGEDHWLSRGATRREMLTATMDFVEKHNPPN